MKITIDTKEDSHEEIRKVINLLTHMIGEHNVSNQNIFDDSPTLDLPTNQPDSAQPSQGNVFGNLFDSSTPKETAEQPQDSAETKEQDDPPEIIPY